MNHGERQEWLASLKEGDAVMIDLRGEDSYVLATIEKITPTGRFRVRGDLYNKEGRHAVDDYRYKDLEKPTEEVREKMKMSVLRNRIVNRATKTFMRNWSLEKLERVYEAMKQD